MSKISIIVSLYRALRIKISVFITYMFIECDKINTKP
jgi:hypothetical protein